MSEWRQLRLGEVLGSKGYIRGPFGSSLKRGELLSSGIPVYEQQHAIYGVREFRFYIDEEKYQELSRFTVQPNDLIVSCSGTLGKISIIRKDDPIGIISQALLIIRPDTTVIDPLFLYYILSSPLGYHSLVSLSSGSVQVNLAKRSVIENISITLPPLPQQHAIVRILSSLDDKIDLNQRMNETLEAMARALFKEWFVDFGPVRAKMEGRQPKGLAPEIAALFPNALDEEGKPAGWEILPLDKMAEFLNGLALQKFPGSAPDDLPVIKIADLRAGMPTNRVYASKAIPSQYIIQNGDVIFSWSGSLIQRIWTGGTGALNQHLFKVSSKRFPKWLHYYWVDHYLPQFQAIAASKATTMGHIQRHHLTEAKAIVGSKSLMDAADMVINPLFERIIANDLESRILTELRDLLLPKLMSGELGLNDAERLVAETL